MAYRDRNINDARERFGLPPLDEVVSNNAPTPSKSGASLFVICLMLYVGWQIVWFSLWPPLDNILVGVFPPFAYWVMKPFVAFLWPVIAATFLLQTITTLCFRKFLKNLFVWWQYPILFWISFLFFFFIGAEVHREILMRSDIALHSPDCTYIDSFSSSLGRAGEYAPAHAYMVKGDTTYIWSYRNARFMQVQDGSFKRKCEE